MDDLTFTFQLRTKVLFGSGILSELGLQAQSFASDRVFVVTDPGLVATGIPDKALRCLGDAGLQTFLWTHVSPDPKDANCTDAAEAAVEFKAQAIVGLGGGSALDTAKATAALATNGGCVKDWEDPRRLDKDPLPMIAVPTTAGTGSEVTWVAVITDEEHHYKMTLLDERLAPDVAILDPELTTSLPPQVTAATGMDALTHAMEAYTCKAANPFSDALALRAATLIGAALPAAVKDGSDASARRDMLLASLLASLAFMNSDVGAVHCMGESLGGLYKTPHGLACAVFLPHVLGFNVEADPAKHADLARALGVNTIGLSNAEAALKVVGATKKLMKEIGIPPLNDLVELKQSDFEALARLSNEHVCSPDNARDIGYEDYLTLFKETYSN